VSCARIRCVNHQHRLYEPDTKLSSGSGGDQNGSIVAVLFILTRCDFLSEY
jgi:hypothetical protein